MAKAIQAHFGTVSNGLGVEWALRADGQWFSRYQNNTPYGVQWSKWAKDDPTWETGGTNAYSGERFEYDEPRIACGFSSPCERIDDDLIPRWRLPND
ncbi:MAG: hypothetical protein GOVbin4162_115 [Prokaryotic dsDNA virus sp.]|nr:MAG: hypothetical protein GOVbin4162_115 [Prokaryotic dsDNA virus sp.]|tara:strand:- start:281 stop:571 length:291 start_codon:yes stop_codon:yes gene_type:complete